MDIKTILEITKDWDEVEIRDLMRQLNLRRDRVTRLWDYVFGRKEITFYDRDRTTGWIDEFDYKLVMAGFTAARDSGVNEKQSIRYIDKVIRNLHQEESLKKAKEFALSKAKEISAITSEPIREKTDMTAWKGFAKKTLGKTRKESDG